MKKFKAFIAKLSLVIFLFLVILTIYLDSLVRDEFNQQAWQIPAKVFARPLSFSLGKDLALKDLKYELDLLGYRPVIKAVSPGQYEQYDNTMVIYTRGFKFWDGFQPEQVLEVTISQGKIVKLKDFSNQKSVNFLRLDPLSLGSIDAANPEDRRLVTLKQLPEHFVTALLNTEDKAFYQHSGISFKGIARAAWSNITQGELAQGGSTLTQQLMKNHFLSNERTIWRKLREAIMAVLTEVHYDKDIILQAYINEVYLGQDGSTAIHGFARASEFYFDKPLENLNLSQTALLVALVNGPSFYNPRKNPDRAKKRRDLVLSQLLGAQLISQEEYDSAASRSLQVVAKPKYRSSKVPAFMGYVKRQLTQEYSLSELYSEGLWLFTSLDPIVQAKAEKAMSSRINQLEKIYTKQKGHLQGANIVADVLTGDILAMVSDRNPNYAGFNRAIDAYRQTGSVIKPFVYLTALEEGRGYDLTSKIQDEAFSLKGSDGSLWTPKNYDKETHGTIELQTGLINSYNLATARLAMSVGVDNVVETVLDAGFTRDIPAYPSVALGSIEMSPLEVLRLYQTLANGGVHVDASGILAVQDHQGNVLQRYPRHASHQLEPQAAFMVKYLLTRVVKEGTGQSVGKYYSRKLYAGKTGTTNDLRDSWFAGFGGSKVAVVWLGRDDNQAMNLTGATGALYVWRDLIGQLDEPSVDLTLPDGLVWASEKRGFFSGFGSCKDEKQLPFWENRIPDDYEVCQ
ncbi:MAG: penicillin-binding protein 1B [Gammaproteobacteria bacterium]|nr:penicillin-binding protein 1B [Gammaproteobacteria bacterium]MDH5628607.1 penicillin-binding protein 1B [Gammaproteobacteria bacterium]